MYRVTTHHEVGEQIAALPDVALVAFAELLDRLVQAPWSGEPYNDTRAAGAMRKQAFGPRGLGLVVYLILEDQRRVDLLRVVWLG